MGVTEIRFRTKICEMCGRSFLRATDSLERDCFSCLGVAAAARRKQAPEVAAAAAERRRIEEIALARRAAMRVLP